MSDLREFITEALEASGAVVESLPEGEIEVLSPESVSRAMGWPELAKISFTLPCRTSSVPMTLESESFGRCGNLLGDRGTWLVRQLEDSPAIPRDAEALIDRAIELPNAVWRFLGHEPARTPCLVLRFRYSALSDEKREGILTLGINLATGSALNGILDKYVMGFVGNSASDSAGMAAAALIGSADFAAIEARIRTLVDHRLRAEIDPFLRAMRRRLDRDCLRVYTYHDDLRREALRRRAQALANGKEEACRRETLRTEAIEREYRAKLDDLKLNYSLNVSAEWIQTLLLVVPVCRFRILVKRRKAERVVAMDWHAHSRLLEPPPCDAGAGFGPVRLACDAAVHLTEPEGQASCESCGRAYCRACRPAGCPRCGKN